MGNEAANANPLPCQHFVFSQFSYFAMILDIHVSPELFLCSLSFFLAEKSVHIL